MKKYIQYLMALVCMLMVLCLSVGTTSYAYTEEEKAQAKAWLSAHGYSPDAGGASQAYQDYLNGKFDEELGITRTEQASSETSETAAETTTEVESTTEKTREQLNTSGDSSTATANMPGQGTDGNETFNEETAIEPKQGETAETQETDTAVDNVEPQTDKETAMDGAITWYRPEWETTYKNAAIVISLSVMLVTICLGFRQLFK